MWGLLCSCWYQGALLGAWGQLWSCAALGSSAQRLERIQSKILHVYGRGNKPKIQEWLMCRAVQAFFPPFLSLPSCSWSGPFLSAEQHRVSELRGGIFRTVVLSPRSVSRGRAAAKPYLVSLRHGRALSAQPALNLLGAPERREGGGSWFGSFNVQRRAKNWLQI